MKKKQRTTDISNFIKTLDREYDFTEIGIDDAGIGFGVWSELREEKRQRGRQRLSITGEGAQERTQELKN